MLPELTTFDYELALDQVAAEALGSPAVENPPVDALNLARLMGVDVAWDKDQAGRGRVVRLRDFSGGVAKGSILVRPEPRWERMQWAIAHEIGELLAVKVFRQLSVDPREAPAGTRERLANQLAGRLLVPRQALASAGADCDWDLVVLKSKFSTASHELLARRMLDLGSGLVVTIFDHGRRTFRRGRLPGRLPPLDPLERDAFREAHQQGQVAAIGDHRLRVRAWPIHEPGWKREILRSEWHTLEACDQPGAEEAVFAA